MVAGYDKAHFLVAGNIMALPHGSFSIAWQGSMQVHGSGFCAIGSSFAKLIHIVFVIGVIFRNCAFLGVWLLCPDLL